MTIGTVIATYRKKMGLTQDALAQQLGVTNQAVSKWESDQSCPDILLLPRIADIFGITIDELFGREKAQAEPAESMELVPAPATEVNDLPWPDDGTLRVVLYAGHTYIGSTPAKEKITFEYNGPALNIECAVNLNCGEVYGNVHAEGDVSCDSVEGNVTAGGDVSCDEVEGSVYAGGNVICEEVSGSVVAGGAVTTDRDSQGSFRFSMDGKGKKNKHDQITMEDTAEDSDAKLENSIEKFVNDIVRKCKDFRF